MNPRIMLCGLAALLFLWGWNAVDHAADGNVNIGFWGAVLASVLGIGIAVQLVQQDNQGK